MSLSVFLDVAFLLCHLLANNHETALERLLDFDLIDFFALR